MRYHIKVYGQMQMSVRYITDAEWFIRDRVSLGQKVEVLDTKTEQTRVVESCEQLLNELGVGA